MIDFNYLSKFLSFPIFKFWNRYIVKLAEHRFSFERCRAKLQLPIGFFTTPVSNIKSITFKIIICVTGVEIELYYQYGSRTRTDETIRIRGKDNSLHRGKWARDAMIIVIGDTIAVSHCSNTYELPIVRCAHIIVNILCQQACKQEAIPTQPL